MMTQWDNPWAKYIWLKEYGVLFIYIFVYDLTVFRALENTIILARRAYIESSSMRQLASRLSALDQRLSMKLSDVTCKWQKSDKYIE